MTELPVFAIADVIIQMIKHSTNVREQRFLRVAKLRGSDSVPGLHAFAIKKEGIEVFPRLLTPPAAPVYSARVERVNTAIPGLDEMIEEGFLARQHHVGGRPYRFRQDNHRPAFYL